MGKKISFWVGLGILVLLGIATFINIQVDSGSNFIEYDSLLGILIFHNPFILGLYVLAGVIMIVRGRK